MTPIEIIALVVIVLSVLKIVLIRKVWIKVVRKLYSAPKVLLLVELALAAIVLYYLLQAGFSIVEILAVVAFGALLTGIGFAAFGRETVSWAGKVLKKDIWKKAWLPILVWLALIVWGALELFNVI